jgi:hypothetical protein
MGVRLYDPTAGRFLQVDPVPGGSANAYDYVNQDPVNGIDLDGRCFWDACLGEGYAVYVVAAAAVAGAYWLYRHPVHLHFSWHRSWHIHLFAHKKKKQSTGNLTSENMKRERLATVETVAERRATPGGGETPTSARRSRI